MNARCGAIALALTALMMVVCGPAWADPLPGEVLKFRQLPLNNGALPALFPPVTAPPIGAPYYGHDELSTAFRTSPGIPWTGTYMADDFADRFNSPVVHVRWWGSYLHDDHGDPMNPGVKQFLISFENDVAAGAPNNPVPWSHPGEVKFNQIVNRAAALAPGSGTFTEKLLPTPIMDGTPPMLPSEALYEYNAELHLGKEFKQERDTVYWLKIVALVDVQRDGQIQWGWHNRDWSIPNPLASVPPPPPPGVTPGEHIIGTVTDPIKGFTSPVWHFQDDAVTGPITVFPNPDMPIMPNVSQQSWTPTNYVFPWDGPDIFQTQQFSKDLAFELYTIPEPSTLMLIGLGALALAAAHRRHAN